VKEIEWHQVDDIVQNSELLGSLSSIVVYIYSYYVFSFCFNHNYAYRFALINSLLLLYFE
jgi:Gpi18-like mannosyltransferase